jgi:cob(I)alamin adenosyltransferase
MKIATKTGDKGKTGRLFGSRVSKTDPVISAVGDIDELNAALGLLKCEITEDVEYVDFLKEIQHKLTLLMGEVASEDDMRAEYVMKYDSLKSEDLESLDRHVTQLENMPVLDQQGWVLYGDSKKGSLCDFASKVCRRAERSTLLVDENEMTQLRDTLKKYLNRLSDFLHLLGRYFDYQQRSLN